ncbi:universal stress protein [Chloroflexota bacterium]
MYRKIVIPLDGSKLAECVLPHLENMTRGSGTEEVTLVRVTEHITRYVPLSGPTFASSSQLAREPSGAPRHKSEIPVHLNRKQVQAQRYLDKIAKQLKKKRGKVKVLTEVPQGNPAEEIASVVKRAGADLILMASHGRSGVSRWAYGSVADKIFRASSVPVLMVKCGSTAGI